MNGQEPPIEGNVNLLRPICCEWRDVWKRGLKQMYGRGAYDAFFTLKIFEVEKVKISVIKKLNFQQLPHKKS